MASKKSKGKLAKREKPEEQTEPEDDGATYTHVVDEHTPEYVLDDDKTPLFVPDDVKLERVKKQVRQDRIKKDRVALDFWLRHTIGLGTKQIKKLWKKIDEIYRR